ncbi:putative Bzz1-Myo3/5p-Bee1p-Vrp1p actin assembly complex component-like protein [Rhizoctonia solani 123E]|uniref:Putative Bzz1-Myo3/5p-Bee1p-Vrp1p actin assembly complex component-like protein n=1 Tax=Rhizoctonia solani 123E TaxID=1423351 RepID=A0A074RRJ7_9AGAM|nr:putative Bzz1-Myo3/5p-Bee1p-Vrp1p actin assembly complex component-like protein [Rhizoctonia solani 123E]
MTTTMSESLSYGRELPDQVPPLNATLTHQITLIIDTRELIKERVALEREYAAKLSVIAKKAEEKRARHMTHAVLGEECSKAWTDADVRSSTLDKAFTALINSYENTASDHDSFASALSADVADALKLLERSKDESRKKQMAFFAKLVAERDRIYGERLKAKQKASTLVLAADDRHADRAAKQLEQQKVEMQNRKKNSAYLIQIAVANGAKDRFYDDELPLLEDQFQSHHADTMRRMTRLLLHSQALHEGHLESVRRSVANTQAALNAVDPLHDQKLYASFNRRPFSKPENWAFEPCDRYYDTPEVVTEPEPKILLQNRLQRARQKLVEITPQIEDKSRDVARLNKLVASYEVNPALGNYDEVWENLLEASHQLTDLELIRVGYQAEMQVVSSALGGDEGARKPHEFKSTSFSIPAPCGYCKTNIWGLSKPGKTCRNCGISVHTRCELKMPAECGIAPELSPSKANSLARASSINSVAPSVSSVASVTSPIGGNPPRANALSRPVPPAASAPPASNSATKAKVLYSYAATSEFEVSITEGTTIQVVEPDDGSGWVKVTNEQGVEGLVPATYVEIVTPALNKRRAPPPPTRNAPGAKLVKALYSYEAQGDDELSLKEGTTYELTPNGENAGDGWWEGVDSSGKKGIFPSNYVRK